MKLPRDILLEQVIVVRECESVIDLNTEAGLYVNPPPPLAVSLLMMCKKEFKSGKGLPY